MKKSRLSFLSVFILLSATSSTSVQAADVEYSVVAFPQNGQNVAVVIGGQSYPLTSSADVPHIYKGVAPSTDHYQYALTNPDNSKILEHSQRQQTAGISSTGNEFFNRSRTVYDVPPIPRAYNPIYPPLSSHMNRSDEIVTIILEANATGLQNILANPLDEHKYIEVSKVTYIANKEVFTFQRAGIKNSGKSTKDFSKQSFKLKLNEFAEKSGGKEMMYGRTTFKLRASQTDPTYIREKLAFDCLEAAGGATLQGHFARLFINNEPFGLFLLTDDSGSTLINDILHGGDQSYEHNGPTYKGNAMTPENEGNLVYKDDSATSYGSDIYDIDDLGNMKTSLNETNQLGPFIDFMKRLSTVDPTQAVDANNRGTLEQLVHSPQHLILHMAINFLTGSYDGFWHQASNYYLHLDTGSHLWTLISYDFDETFGLNTPRYMATTPYSNYSRPNAQRPLIDGILKSPYYKSEFEKTLQKLVKKFFKPSVIQPRLEAWKSMLREDVEWDLAIPPKSPGIVPTWTAWNFENNLNTSEDSALGVAEWVQLRATSLQEQLSFTDVDDLPPLEAYVYKNIWDPNNYVKNKSAPTGDNKQISGASALSSHCIHFLASSVIGLVLIQAFT